MINLHPSLLPSYRGLEPVLRAMASGDRNFGVTVHRLAESIDTGSIITQSAFAPQPGHSVLRSTYELFRCGADEIIAALDRIVDSHDDNPQPPGGSYYSWPSGRDICQLYRKGKHLAKPSDLALFWRSQ